MTKNKSNASTKGNKQPAQKGGGRKVAPGNRRVAMQVNASSGSIRAYLQMLADPCSATPVNAPYAGTESGYLARTVDIISMSSTQALSTGVAGAATVLDGYISYVPSQSFNTTSGTPFYVGGGSSGASFPTGTYRPTNFMTVTSSAVGKYRPVACCLRYVTTSTYGGRGGEIGVGYNPQGHVTGATSRTAADLLPLAQMRSGNGTSKFEVKWLPTDTDQGWIDKNVSSYVGDGGGVFLIFKGVDATYVTTTSANLNGFVEATTIWEWVPDVLNGLSISMKSPSPYTLNSALSMIKDIGKFVISDVAQEGYSLLTGGYKAKTRLPSNNLISM